MSWWSLKTLMLTPWVSTRHGRAHARMQQTLVVTNTSSAYCFLTQRSSTRARRLPRGKGQRLLRQLIRRGEPTVHGRQCSCASFLSQANKPCFWPHEQADHLSRRGIEGEWFFCRGFFRQSTGEFVLWRAVPEEGADSDDVRLHAMSAHARKRMKVGRQEDSCIGW